MSLFHKIIVALRGDGDETDLLDLAIKLSRDDGSIRAFHAIDIPRQGIFGDDVLPAHERMLERIGMRLQEDLGKVLHTAETGPRELSGEIREGRPHEQIMRAAEDWNADLILVGGAGHKGLDATALASESMALVEQAHRPVYVARNGETPGVVVAPVNFGPLTERGVEMAGGLAKAWNAKLQLLHVATGSWPLYPEYGAEEWWDTPYAGTGGDGIPRTKASEDLKRLAAATGDRYGLEVEAIQLGGAVPAYVIAQHVRSLDQPLVGMGTLGRGLSRGVHLGDTARRFLRSSGRSLLTFKTEEFRPRILELPEDESKFKRKF